MTTEIDLAVAWEWPPDAEFVRRLLSRAGSQGHTVLAITTGNLQAVLSELATAGLCIQTLLDRASDERPEFAPLTPLVERNGSRIINHMRVQSLACDKARNHQICASQGIPVPLTIILPPFNEDPTPPVLPAALGRPFVCKPAGGGGGVGVVLDAHTVQDVQSARRYFGRDRYLLQECVVPATLGGRRAWFRVFFLCGQALPCWWDDLTHIYTPLSSQEEDRFGLAGLRRIVLELGRIMALDFFTTEIAMGSGGRLVCVDYANSPCDMRLQSQHPDGVPDALVDRIVEGLLSCCPARTSRPIAGRTRSTTCFRHRPTDCG